ncbi:MAG: hypothetical protein V4556_13710 [Bacteroidota bacterium]
MQQPILPFLNGIEKCTSDKKADQLISIGNLIRTNQYKDEQITILVQQLIDMLPNEDELVIRELIFRNISLIYSKKTDLHSVKLTHILNILDESGPFFICNTLTLLSQTNNKKYFPVISRYVYYTDENVREVAIRALTFLQHCA